MEKNSDKKMFGVSVKAWRAVRGFSQEVLAERAELHRTYISDIERGSRNVSLQNIAKLARALDISVAALFPQSLENKIKEVLPAAVTERKLVDILMVEDNADDVELTSQAFKRANFTNLVYIARDGGQALDFLFCRGEHAGRRFANQPDLILLDLQLPKVNGLDVLRRIKSDERTRHIQVVVLTSSQMFNDMEECQALGATSYIVKPLNFEKLSRIVPNLHLEWSLYQPVEASRLSHQKFSGTASHRPQPEKPA